MLVDDEAKSHGYSPSFGYAAEPNLPLSTARPRLGVARLSGRPPCLVDSRPFGGHCPPYSLIAAKRRSHTSPAGAGGRGVYEAKRIGATTLLCRQEGSPGFPLELRSKGPASLSTIDGATMRLCRADLPAAALSIAAGSRSHRGRTFLVGCAHPRLPEAEESAPRSP